MTRRRIRLSTRHEAPPLGKIPSFQGVPSLPSCCTVWRSQARIPQRPTMVEGLHYTSCITQTQQAFQIGKKSDWMCVNIVMIIMIKKKIGAGTGIISVSADIQIQISDWNWKKWTGASPEEPWRFNMATSVEEEHKNTKKLTVRRRKHNNSYFQVIIH